MGYWGRWCLPFSPRVLTWWHNPSILSPNLQSFYNVFYSATSFVLLAKGAEWVWSRCFCCSAAQCGASLTRKRHRRAAHGRSGATGINGWPPPDSRFPDGSHSSWWSWQRCCHLQLSPAPRASLQQPNHTSAQSSRMEWRLWHPGPSQAATTTTQLKSLLPAKSSNTRPPV